MIKSFSHTGLAKFYETGSKAGIQPSHAERLRRQLAVLDSAVSILDLPPSWKPHPLKGEWHGHFSIWVSGNWRITFRFEGTDVYLVDYQDYH